MSKEKKLGNPLNFWFRAALPDLYAGSPGPALAGRYLVGPGAPAQPLHLPAPQPRQHQHCRQVADGHKVYIIEGFLLALSVHII